MKTSDEFLEELKNECVKQIEGSLTDDNDPNLIRYNLMTWFNLNIKQFQAEQKKVSDENVL